MNVCSTVICSLFLLPACLFVPQSICKGHSRPPHPTVKLLNKITDHCHKVAKAEGIKVRQSYAREVKCLKLTQRSRGKSYSRKKVARADRRMRTIAGRLVRELLRELPSDSKYREHLELCLRFVNGELLDGHKIYSLHEPDVPCICKGKEHKKYEFGNKVSIVRLWNGVWAYTLVRSLKRESVKCYVLELKKPTYP